MEITPFFRETDDIWDPFNLYPMMRRMTQPKEGTTNMALDFWRPRCDVSETDKQIMVHAELPGCKKENIHVELNDNMLTINGETQQERTKETRQYYTSERNYGKFRRSIRVPRGIDEDSINASYKDGVLTVTVPKPEGGTSRQRHRIDIKTD